MGMGISSGSDQPVNLSQIRDLINIGSKVGQTEIKKLSQDQRATILDFFEILNHLDINNIDEDLSEIFTKYSFKELDDSETLYQLYRMLADHGISPYYLHQLDRVQGAAHFEVEEARGLILVQALAKRLPGYAIPEYVREVAGQPHKERILRTKDT